MININFGDIILIILSIDIDRCVKIFANIQFTFIFGQAVLGEQKGILVNNFKIEINIQDNLSVHYIPDDPFAVEVRWICQRIVGRCQGSSSRS